MAVPIRLTIRDRSSGNDEDDERYDRCRKRQGKSLHVSPPLCLQKNPLPGSTRRHSSEGFAPSLIGGRRLGIPLVIIETAKAGVGRDGQYAVLAYVGGFFTDSSSLQARRERPHGCSQQRGGCRQIVATLVGSIGLIAAVPITTALAALLALHGAPL